MFPECSLNVSLKAMKEKDQKPDDLAALMGKMAELQMSVGSVMSREPVVLLVSNASVLRPEVPLIDQLIKGCVALSQVSAAALAKTLTSSNPNISKPISKP
jgi:hypothetical protein